jgi:hypothetical protein
MDISEYARTMRQSCMLIISGPDRAGKDWLAEKLHKRMCASYTALMKPMHLFDAEAKRAGTAQLVAVHTDWLAEWRHQIDEALAGWKTYHRPTRTIIDRLFPDEWAYAKAMGRSTYHDSTFVQMDRAWAEAGAKWLLVTEDIDTISLRWDDTQEKLAIMGAVLENFREYSRRTAMEWMVVNTRDASVVDEVVSWVLRS